MVIDCHCHLSDGEFEEDLNDVIDRAKQIGVKACICVTEFYNDFEKTLQLCQKYPGFIHPSVGIHPVQLQNDTQRSALIQDVTDDVVNFINANSQHLIAIGEIGLDFTPRYHDSLKQSGVDSHAEQRGVFMKQIEIAKRLDLPVNVHSRSAGKPTIEVLKQCGAERVVLHAFDGNWKSAVAGVQLGYYFSVPPCIARSEQKQKLVANLPLEQMLLETDSPALGPERGKRNEVSNIEVSVEWISKIKKVSAEHVRTITTENAIKLFPALKASVANST